mmetsp:Transcript_139299/g.433385  ORF Transcript_139299/g.433385 Transcript_139299/m.433385 type:complete len:203 (+) Transcript_139299:248-856(+)
MVRLPEERPPLAVQAGGGGRGHVQSTASRCPDRAAEHEDRREEEQRVHKGEQRHQQDDQPKSHEELQRAEDEEQGATHRGHRRAEQALAHGDQGEPCHAEPLLADKVAGGHVASVCGRQRSVDVGVGDVQVEGEDVAKEDDQRHDLDGPDLPLHDGHHEEEQRQHDEHGAEHGEHHEQAVPCEEEDRNGARSHGDQNDGHGG